jgi:hypothetical protein
VELDTPVPDRARPDDGSQEPRGLGAAHALENYAVGARLVDASGAPSLAPASALLATAAAAGTAHRYSFTATRKPLPAQDVGPRTPRGSRDGGSRLNP